MESTEQSAIVRVQVNAMEGEAVKHAAEDVFGLETYYDDGTVIEVGDAETKDDLVEKIYEMARKRGIWGDYEGAQWYDDAAWKVDEADLEQKEVDDA